VPIRNDRATRLSLMVRTEISVIVPCYNEEHNIDKCLQTLSHQSIDDYEIIVIDDGSTDGTKEIAKKFNVRFLEQSHCGPAAARNRGAQEATGTILVFVDADMFFDRHFLERLTAPIQAGKAIGTFTKDEFVGNGDNVWAVCWNLETVDSTNRRVSTNQPDDSVVFRAVLREEFLRVEGFDTTVGYDDDHTLHPKLGVKATLASGAICYHNNPGTLREVFASARWIGRGRRFSDHPERLIKFFPPFTLYFAVAKAIRYERTAYIVFKLVHDCGITMGGLSRLLFQQYMK
jgi:glycosyltransferase involved in cell wall biosynthesis